jgi:hypothetical protein
LLSALCARAADAATEARLEGGTLFFYSDSLGIAARSGARFVLAGGTIVSGAAAYVDLRNDRAVVAGGVQIARGGATLRGDAVAFDLDGRRFDLLQTASGIGRVDAAFAQVQPAPGDADRFAFPDVPDARAYIRARRAEIVARTSVRFRPAAFPTSTGAPPVPMYLYTFAAGNGYAATPFAPAAFDQPYGLSSTPNGLLQAHLRYLNGSGPSIGLSENVIDNNDGYLAGGVETPLRARIAEGLTGYRPLGASGSVSLNASSNNGLHVAQLGFTQAVGSLVSRLNYGITNGGYSSALLSLRTREQQLGGGFSGHTSINFGFQAQSGGLLLLAPNPHIDSTIWQHGIDVFLASPLVHGPFRTTLSATADGSRTDYSYPRHYNALETVVSGSRRIDRALTLFFGYDARWSADIFPNAQTLFYPPAATPYGYAGYGTMRLANADLQYVVGSATSVRVSYRHANDFPQANFFAGRPPNEVRADVRLRPASNIGLSFGRSYDFGWNGSRWVPGWNLSVFQ